MSIRLVRVDRPHTTLLLVLLNLAAPTGATLLAAVSSTGCGARTEEPNGTETGNPFVHNERISVTATADGVLISGKPGAVNGGASVRAVNTDTGAAESTEAAEDGSFELEIGGTVDDEYEVTVDGTERVVLGGSGGDDDDGDGAGGAPTDGADATDGAMGGQANGGAGGADTPPECREQGAYEAGKEGSYLPCCDGLTEVFYQQGAYDADGQPVCVEPLARFYACVEGSCGDGNCEVGEDVTCGCAEDCPGAVWEGSGDASVPMPMINDGPAVTCEQAAELTGDQLSMIADGADLSCDSALDCTRVSYYAPCAIDRCATSSPVARSDAERVQSAIDDVVTLCENQAPDCEPQVQCEPEVPWVAGCDGGQCTRVSGCTNVVDLLVGEVAALADGLDRNCSSDEDCAIVALDSVCAVSCDHAPLSAAGADEFRSRLTEFEAAMCDQFEATGCAPNPVECAAPPIAACSDGVCSAL